MTPPLSPALLESVAARQRVSTAVRTLRESLA